MAIINRSLDVSEQKEVVTWSAMSGVTLAAGASVPFYRVPYPAQLIAFKAVAFANGGSCVLLIQNTRFTATGQTIIAVGLTGLVPQNFSTSGPLGFSGLPAPGSTLNMLQEGDVLTFHNSQGAVEKLIVTAVVQKLQDIANPLNSN